MNDMDKLKKLQMVAKLLRKHHGYKGNKESDFMNRFDFKFDKSSPCIDIFNAEKGANLFLWEDIISLAHGMHLDHYITYDKYDLKEVVVRLY